MKFEHGDTVIIEDIEFSDGFYDKRKEYIGREFHLTSSTRYQKIFSSNKDYVTCSGNLVSNNEYCFFLSVKLGSIIKFKLPKDLFEI
jgi:hypothetical protein